jgi:hypothetical protein
MDSLNSGRTASGEPADEFVFRRLHEQVADLVEEKRTSQRLLGPFEFASASWRGVPIPIDPPPELTLAKVTVVCHAEGAASGVRLGGMSGTGEFYTLTDSETIPLSVNGYGHRVTFDDVDISRLLFAGQPGVLFVEVQSGLTGASDTYNTSGERGFGAVLNVGATTVYDDHGDDPFILTIRRKSNNEPLLPDTGSSPLTWQAKYIDSDGFVGVEPLFDNDTLAVLKGGAYEAHIEFIAKLTVFSVLVEFKHGAHTTQSRIPEDLVNPLTTGKPLSARRALLLYGMQETLYFQRVPHTIGTEPIRILDLDGDYQDVAEFVVDAGELVYNTTQVRREYELTFDWCALTRTDEELIASVQWEGLSVTRSVDLDGEEVGALTIDAVDWAFDGREGYLQRVYAQARKTSYLVGLFSRDAYRFAKWGRFNAIIRLTDGVKYLRVQAKLENFSDISEFSSYNKLVISSAQLCLLRRSNANI